MYTGIQDFIYKEEWQWEGSTHCCCMKGYKEMKNCTKKINHRETKKKSASTCSFLQEKKCVAHPKLKMA